MIFLLKKIFTLFFFPLSLSLGLLTTGVFFLWFSKKQKTGKIIITVSALLLITTSYGLFSSLGLKWLESRYPPIDLTHASQAKWVVVLGGGIISDPKITLISQLSKSTLIRLLEGVCLYRKIPGSKLILSGGRVFNGPAEAELMGKVAVSLGVSLSDMILECDSRDTSDQASIMKRYVGKDPFILVTSAYHMKRSMLLFTKQGMQPIPAPTDFLMISSSVIRPASFFPRGAVIDETEKMIHELLGILWLESSRFIKE
jgi:uncharacterized SAM-binding protein YcdF (DUF218 family)